jgi:hypothetical protein
MREPCQRVRCVSSRFAWESLRELQIPSALRNHMMQKLSCDENPSASVLRAGKPSILGQLLDVSLAAGEQYRGLMSVDHRAQP